MEEQQRQSQDDQLRRQTIAGQRAVGLMRSGLSRGRSPQEIMTRLGPSLQALGVQPDDFEGLQDILTNNPDALDDIDAALKAQTTTRRRLVGNPVEVRLADGSTGLQRTFTDGTTEFEPGAAIISNDLARGRLDAAQESQEIRQTDSGRKLLKDNRAELEKIQEERAFNETTINAAETVVRDIGAIQDIAQTASEFEGNSLSEALRRAVGARVLSTDANSVNQLLDSVKSNIGIDSLLRIKRSGSGLGQVPQSQLETLQGLLGKLDITRDPKLLMRDLNDIDNLYGDIISKAGEDIDRLNQREDRLLNRREGIEGRTFGERQEQAAQDLQALSDEDLARMLQEMSGE